MQTDRTTLGIIEVGLKRERFLRAGLLNLSGHRKICVGLDGDPRDASRLAR